MDAYLKTLREIGLAEKEAQVYLALLSIGSSTVNSIAEKSDIVRTTTYDVLKSLREKGIVSSVIKNKILYFEAADPAKLVETLEERKQKLKQLVPQLRTIYSPPLGKPAMEVYEGKEGIKTVWEDILVEKKTLYCIANAKLLYKLLPFVSPRFVQRRAKRGIPVKALLERTKQSTKLQTNASELRETRYIPQLKNINITEYIYGSSVAVIGTNPKNPLGIIIRHADFAKEQKLLFELLWKTAEE